MLNGFRNDKGITLVELLAVLAIGGIVMVLLMSIFSNGQNQYSSQTAKAEQLNDIRYAAKVITKEIRKADKVISKQDEIILGESTPVKFEKVNGEILKNGTPLISNVSIFTIRKVTSTDRNMVINIESTDNKGKKQSIRTVIYIRDGVIIE